MGIIIQDHTDKIIQSKWWSRASACADSHYSNTSGVKLVHHLLEVTENIDHIFNRPLFGFHAELFSLLKSLSLDREKVNNELKIISLLHDIGKVEDDKMLYIIHPLNNELVLKRHTVVSVYAAKDILEMDTFLNETEKSRIYWAIEQHDVSYGLYRQFLQTGYLPDFEIWKTLNDKIHPNDGAGLLYLLIFKLADIHGHANIHDVIWFYKTVQEKYFSPLGLYLPIPVEEDVR